MVNRSEIVAKNMSTVNKQSEHGAASIAKSSECHGRRHKLHLPEDHLTSYTGVSSTGHTETSKHTVTTAHKLTSDAVTSKRTALAPLYPPSSSASNPLISSALNIPMTSFDKSKINDDRA